MSNLDPYDGRIPTRAEAIARAGARLAEALAEIDDKTPREVAEQSGAVARGEATVDEIEDRVRAQRGMPPLERPADAQSAPPVRRRRARDGATGPARRVGLDLDMLELPAPPPVPAEVSPETAPAEPPGDHASAATGDPGAALEVLAGMSDEEVLRALAAVRAGRG